MSKFYELLSNADSEKIVEELYHNELKSALLKQIISCGNWETYNKTDGHIKGYFSLDDKDYVLDLIVETKYNKNFTSATVRSGAIIQCLFYLHIFLDSCKDLPSVIFIGDKNHCFFFHRNRLLKYLRRTDIKWEIAPSKAAEKLPDLVVELAEDVDLQSSCFLHTIDEKFDMVEIAFAIKELTAHEKSIVLLNERNIYSIFEYFTINVLKNKPDGSSLYTIREQVEYLMQLIINYDECYLIPRKKDKAYINGHKVEVNSNGFNQLINRYNFDVTPETKRLLTSMQDRLLEDVERRNKGDFYTPTSWTNAADDLLTETLGDEWKKKYIVWDCCCGTKNLTRNYVFNNLFCSTYFEEDINVSEKYNRKSLTFQYDFLNDDVNNMLFVLNKSIDGYEITIDDFKDWTLYKKAPKLIEMLLKGKPLLFFINPPYATSGDIKYKSKNGEKKVNVAKNKINEAMTSAEIGQCAKQLYSQFIYRIMLFQKIFGNVSFGTFAPTQLLTSWDNYYLLEELSKENLNFTRGFMFQASEFSGVAKNWSILFSLFSKTKNETVLDVCVSSVTGVNKIGEHRLYMLKKEDKANDWAVAPTRGLPSTRDALTLSSALNPKIISKTNATVNDCIGGFFSDSNCIEKNNQFVAIGSAMFSSAASKCIHKSNFERVISVYTARRLITGDYINWVNSKDEYMIPNINSPDYQKWLSDCLVFSVFDTQSNQSSLRNVELCNKQWDLNNEFFYCSRQEMDNLSNGRCASDEFGIYTVKSNDDVYEDLQSNGFSERYVYEQLIKRKSQMSPLAIKVLNKGRELTFKSFQYRRIIISEHPEYHLNAWDAGFYQIRKILEVYMVDEYEEFKILFNEFRNYLRPFVYSLGFLYDNTSN